MIFYSISLFRFCLFFMCGGGGGSVRGSSFRIDFINEALPTATGRY